MVNIKYVITDVIEEKTYVGIFVDYWIDDVKKKEQFSFNPINFYDNKTDCLAQIENHFKDLKKSLNLKKESNSDLIGVEKEL
jgi:hypothetical protein